MKNELYLAESRVGGRGVFAGRAFKLNEGVYQPSGRIVQASEIDWDALGKEGYDGFMQTGAWEYMDARQDPFARFFNHSCDPNLGFKTLEGRMTLVAIKSIKKKTELTCDYSTTMFEELDEEPMPCKCGVRQCRKIVGDFRHLPKDVQQRYLGLGVVPSYVLGECTQKTPMLINKSFE